MAIKSEVIDQQKPEAKPFPKLMVNESIGKVILATSESIRGFTGTLIYTNTNDTDYNNEVGYYCEFWNCDFVDYNGSITLSND